MSMKNTSMKWGMAMSLVLGFMLSCGSAKSGNEGSIKGTIKNANGQSVYLEELTPEKIILIDSTKVKEDGSFSFKKSTRSINYYRVRLGKEQPANQYASPTNVVVFITDSTEKLVIEADGTNMNGTFKVTGSKETDLLQEINTFLLKGEKSIDSLNKLYEANPATFNQQEGQMIFNDITQKRMTYMRKFALDHSENFVVLQALPFLNPDADLDIFKNINVSLSKKYPKNGWVQNLGKRVEQLSFLAPGTPAPEFTVKTPEDKDISLKDFRGKVTLIDFWASWCRPCRAENPAVVATYTKYKGKGFAIFSVSLDQNKDAWVKAIADDKMTWSHGSDLKYWDAAPAKLYNVTSIPYNVLIDKEGKVIAKNLHGADLENKLAEVLK